MLNTNLEEGHNMQANWSLILNVLLLVGVIVAIGRLMKARRQTFNQKVQQSPVIPQNEAYKNFDEIIAVRKVSVRPEPEESTAIPVNIQKTPHIPTEDVYQDEPIDNRNESGQSVMLFLQAKDDRRVAGYELLQTVLAAGLRFGEGQLFHRHQQINGQGPVLFSLAAATSSGVFDLQNIGAFSAKGLCLFMQTSGNVTVDAERFEIMLATAKQLCEGLDTRLLDDKQRLFSEASMARYQGIIQFEHDAMLI